MPLSGDFTPGPIYFLGTDGADTLIGTEAGDVLYGYGGNDSLAGGGGNDTIAGGSGTNRIDGGAGNDLIIIDRTATNGAMMTPADGVVGGDGYDTLQFLGNFAEFHVVNVVGYGLTITDLTGGARTIATGIEHLQFADLDIWLVDPNLSAPVVSGVVSAATVEGGLPASVNLLALASDPDPNSELGVIGLGPLPAGVSYDAMTTTATIDPAAFDYLGQGVTEVVTLAYQVTDGLRQTAAFAQFTVTGENDAASFAGLSAAITEDQSGAAGQVVVSDADRGEGALVTAGVFATAHGVLVLQDGVWSFRLDGDLLDVQALAAGSSLVDSVSVASVDGSVAEISVTVQGLGDSWQLGAGAVTGTGGADWLYGMDGADTLSGRSGGDLLDGRGGADRLLAGGGNDRVVWDAADVLADGEAGVDTLVLRGGAQVNLGAADQVAGDAGLTRGFEAVDATFSLQAVQLTGSDAANRLTGGYGDDRLAGGRGADVLTGGLGADVFVFAQRDSLRSAADLITDFTSGQDRIDLSAIDADTGLAGDQAFAFVGSAGFSGAAGELRLAMVGGALQLQGDMTGDGAADFALRLDMIGGGAPALGDLIL